MRHLNYSHLLYFWTVARHNSMARAAEELHVTPQTISGQLKLLEESIGQPLFHRVGRGLVLTDAGRVIKQYADEIFALGGELSQLVRSQSLGSRVSVNIGVVDSIAKLISYRLIKPALEVAEPPRVVCREGQLERLLADLALHKIDVVISDRPVPPDLSIKVFDHPLGSSALSFYATDALAATLKDNFPQSLHGAPLLLPVSSSATRQHLVEWFDVIDIKPVIVAEFEDSALLKAFGEAGIGAFAAPAAIGDSIESKYDVKCIGTSEVTESYFAITSSRKISNPAVVAITERASDTLEAVA